MLAAAAMGIGGGVTTAHATGPTVNGAGSTWVQIALDQWRADIARQGYSINFQGVGSSAGREFYIINQVDFAASEIPFQPDEVAQLQGEHKSYQYVPDVAGGTSMMYNLHSPSGARITTLRLDAPTAARIFTGGITSWQDGAIQALNPGLAIAETTVIPVIRSDGSGTSAQFSLYLADQASSVWNAFVSSQGCPAPCSQWPPFPGSTQQKGSDGVANFVSNDAIGKGAIGYVEAGYAYQRYFPVVNLHNASGNFVQPTSANVATALVHAQLNADLTQNLTNVYRAPEPTAYPMSSYSYLITQTTGFDPAKGAVLGAWMIYIACSGQREAAPLGYSPLPPNLIGAVFDAVRRIPGAPAPPPVDAAHCPNPTLTGAPITGPGENNAGASAGSTASSGGGSGNTRSGGGAAQTGTSGGGAVSSGGAAAATGAAAQTAAPGTSGTDDSSPAAGDSNAAATAAIPVLDANARQASFLLAEQAARAAASSPVTWFVVAALLVLIVMFGPLLAGTLTARARRRSGEHVDAP
jgi:phosphate transport system substrate-binding protein